MINYVVPCWSGRRRMIDPYYEKDKTLYLKVFLHEISYFKNKLGQITLVINKNQEEDENYRDFLAQLPYAINGTPIVVLRRESNKRMLFGAWDFVYSVYKDQFSHYLFAEDDYAPAIHNFDSILLENMPSKCGFFCNKIAYVNKQQLPGLKQLPDLYRVPWFSIGLVPEECLKSLYNSYGKLPYPDTEQYQEIDYGIIFHAINGEGYTIDELDNYSVIVLQHAHNGGEDKRTGYFGTYGTGPVMFAPVQYTVKYKELINDIY